MANITNISITLNMLTIAGVRQAIAETQEHLHRNKASGQLNIVLTPSSRMVIKPDRCNNSCTVSQVSSFKIAIIEELISIEKNHNEANNLEINLIISYKVRCLGQPSPDLEVGVLVVSDSQDGWAKDVQSRAIVIIWKKAAP